MSNTTFVQRLQTKGGVDAALRTLADARTLLGSSADLTQAHAALLALQKQLKTGEYIVVDPDLSGYRYVTCFYPEGSRREVVRGHSSIHQVADLALELDMPVVIGGEVEDWREQTACKLRKAGVVAITEMED